MSVRKSWTVWCDECKISDEGDLGAETAQERREELKREGWHINLPGGRDLCDECWAEGVR